jgi:uncharacterized protein YfaS (alpha-2-macroglobulin family)
MVIKSNLFAQTKKNDQANIEFDNKNYNKAIELFNNNLKNETDSNKINLIKYKIGLCYFYLDDYEKLDSVINNIREYNNNDVWEAKSFYLEGIRYLKNYDKRKGIQLLEKARTFYLKYLPITEITKEDIITLDVILIQNIEQTMYSWDWGNRETDDVEEIKRKEEESLVKEENLFSSDWEARKKIVFLYRDVLSYQKDDMDNYYKFIYDYANYFRRNARTEIYTNEYKRQFDNIINNSNDNNLIASCYYLLGVTCKDKSDFTEAIDYFNILIKKYPKNKWIKNAESFIKIIKEPHLNVDMRDPYFANDTIISIIRSTNVKNVRYKIYEIDLVAFYKDNISTKNFRNKTPSQYFSNMEDIKKYIIKEHLNWNINTSTKGDYKECTDTVKIVDTKVYNKIGQYLLVASSEGLTVTSVFFITDLILVNRSENNTVHSWVVDSKTGKPLKDVSVLTCSFNWSNNARLINGKTNDNGLCSTNITNYNSGIMSIAYKDKSFALTNEIYLSRYSRDESSIVRYSITDRPIYRPGQTVHFKYIFRNKKDEELEPLKNRTVVLSIKDSRYQEIYKKTLITNEYGSISDEILLDEDATLGIYNFAVFVEGSDKYESSSQAFVVEEYKRPEYEVNIESGSENLKLGQNVEFKISARYYYGEPVSNAEVTYTVLRSRYRFNDYYPLPILRGASKKINIYNPWWYYDKNEELVESKTLPLNLDGTLTLSYETESLLSNNDWDHDYKYTIKAEVRDESRRVVEQNKSFIVSRKEFNVVINNERGFITPNENAKFEIIAKTNNNELKIADGIIQIFKINPKDKKDDYDSVLIKSVKFKTNKENSYFTYKFSESGKYKIEFETKDVDGQVVSSYIYFYVVDSKFSGKSYYFDKLEVIPEKNTYSEGEDLRILINSDVLSPSLLISVEAENKILKQEVIKIEGKSFIYSYTISKRDIPNIFVKVYLINGNKVFMEESEIFVPPVKQFINISITADKEKYEPNEKVNLKIKAVDYKNDPIKSEISLSVFDASLRGLQDFLSPQIKEYFYGKLRTNNIIHRLSTDYSLGSNLVSTRALIKYPFEYPDGYWSFSSFFNNYARGVNYELARLSNKRTMKAKSVMSDANSIDEQDFAKRAPIPAGAGDEGGSLNQGIDRNKIRANFQELLYWNSSLITNENGIAEVSFDINDALTEWDVVAKGVTKKSEVGESEISLISKKDFIVRVQSPRFLQERDEVTISANIHNYTSKSFNVSSLIEYDKQVLQLLTKEQIIAVIDKESEIRTDWVFKVIRKGSTDITIIAKGNQNFDAAKIKLPILEYGSEKTMVYNESCNDKNESIIEIDIPNEVRDNSANITINLSPTFATIVLSALPYLVHYPYGCFEQTLNRFIPITVVSKIMKDFNIDLYDIKEYNQKIDKKFLEPLTEIFDRKKIEKIKQESLKNVYKLQNSNGSFSWWQSEPGDLYMTALGVISLSTAVRMDINVDNKIIDKAVNYLNNQVNYRENIDNNLAVFIYYALSECNPKLISNGKLDTLFVLRDELSYYSIALLGLAYRNLFRYENGIFDKHSRILIDKDNPIIKSKTNSNSLSKLKIILSNLLDRMEVDNTNNTAFWKLKSPYYWRWYNSNIETSATILKFINSVDPENENLIKVINWLVNNRRGNVWYSTKDTGLLLEILMEYIKIHGELDVDYVLTVSLDGEPIKEVKVDRDNIFTFDNKIKIEKLATGKHKIKVEKKGVGNLNYQVLLNYFSKEDSISSAGNEIFIQREYYRLIKENIKNDNGLQNISYKEVPLLNDETVTSGDEIRVKLKIKSKNDYEYLAFEDRKPSGAEYKLLRSWGGYMELRDEKVLFFRTSLRQGMTEIQYDLRAEIPGKFNVMPAIGYAMYVPDIATNSNSIKINVVDKTVNKEK